MNAILLFIEWITGFLLFSAKKLLRRKTGDVKNPGRVSVIIPARNEEHSLPHLLDSLKNQTLKPYEIIVVDDGSEDKTSEIAKKYGAIVVRNEKVEKGWTGKSWAVWRGFLKSSGDILVFLDADVRLKPEAIEELIYLRGKTNGVISVFPYHYTERLYEKFSILFNFLGALTFTSPFERVLKKGGMCGAVLICTRDDYVKIGGHSSVRAEIVEDMALGRMFEEEGIPVETYLGYRLVSFRMYPDGYMSLVEGFTKNTAKGALSISLPTLSLLIFWFSGLLSTGIVFFLNLLRGTLELNHYAIFYFLYTLQLLSLGRFIGNFGFILPVFHIFPSVFFLSIFLNSIYRYYIRGIVSWKDRAISIRGWGK